MQPNLLAIVSALAGREEPFAVVTVVRREPPRSVRGGEPVFVTATGEFHGWVGGGCTRSTVLREAGRALATEEPRLIRLSPNPVAAARPGFVALPMPCDSGGTVELDVEPVLPVSRLQLRKAKGAAA